MKASVPTDTHNKEGRREISSNSPSAEDANASIGSSAAVCAKDETARMLRTLLGNLDGMVYRCRDDAHILRHGVEIEVHEPESLRTEVAEQHRRAAAIYS